MRRCLLLMFLCVLFLTGCGIKVVPRTVPNATVDSANQTITASQNDLTVSAKVQDLDFGPYTGQNNVTSFYVVVANAGNTDRTVPLSAFMLFDQEQHLYRPLEPERVTALTRQEANHLIPYPYVGFYYLQDSAEFDFTAQTSSSLPYTSTKISPDAESDALPVGAIPPGAKMAGMLYFNIDLYEKKSVNLTLRLPAEGEQPATDFSFLFDVVK